ncbi:MAG: BMP family ABC transporter substrate-binding protein [Clostridia bacterium]|nr:BMP family ABC transporter substrate-binding protein [Clostridia bacterium]MBQ3870549.1 BMP family ABC transporter substrate-binding protein [Clostridia bacterium]
MFKKVFALVLACIMVVAALASCGGTTTAKKGLTEKDLLVADPLAKFEVKDDFKIGVICLHDENSTYDNNFIKAIKEVKTLLGLKDEQVLIKVNIAESDQCAQTARDLVEQGCKIVFADSFGHESFLLTVAKEHPEVQFCHATGTNAHLEKLDNFHNAFAAIYEGRYLAGIAAGLKLNEMIKNGKIKAEEAVIGYVGAFTYAEVISGLSSFFLGARSVCPSATMKVRFTGSWYDQSGEQEAAEALIQEKCVLISQHADSLGAPTTCEKNNVPNVSYNGSTYDAGENTFIISSAINWAPYFHYIIKQVTDGQPIATDWTGTIATGSVVLSQLNLDVAAEGTEKAIADAVAKFKAGTLHVFDTETFTVGGKKLDAAHKPGEGTDAAFADGTVIVADGYFHESEYRSAPYFDVTIDGITFLNVQF